MKGLSQTAVILKTAGKGCTPPPSLHELVCPLVPVFIIVQIYYYLVLVRIHLDNLTCFCFHCLHDDLQDGWFNSHTYIYQDKPLQLLYDVSESTDTVYKVNTLQKC